MRDSADQIEQDVKAAYQWILGRPADENGLGHYAHALRTGKLTQAGLRRIFLDSPEFKESTPRYVVVDIGNDVRVVVDPDEPEFGRYIAEGGGWEPHIATAIKTQLRAGDTFVDVGGNVGVMSFHAAAIVGPVGKVIAFEPNATNVAAFRRGMVVNEFSHVRLFPLALSDTHEMISLSRASNAKVQGKACTIDADNIIEAIRGDEILLHEARIDLIKIDVEGFEQRVLRGLRDVIGRFKPNIVCEFNPLCLREQGGIDPADLARDLFSLAPFCDLVEHDGSYTRVRSADELMALWARRDAEATASGALPAGWVHFDILLQTKSG